MGASGLLLTLPFLALWVALNQRKEEEIYKNKKEEQDKKIDAYYKKDMANVKRLITRYKNNMNKGQKVKLISDMGPIEDNIAVLKGKVGKIVDIDRDFYLVKFSVPQKYRDRLLQPNSMWLMKGDLQEV